MVPLFVFPVLLLVFLAPIIAIVAIIRALTRRSGEPQLTEEDEARLRRLMEAMQKMETRIANLETILEPPRESPQGAKPGEQERR